MESPSEATEHVGERHEGTNIHVDVDGHISTGLHEQRSCPRLKQHSPPRERIAAPPDTPPREKTTFEIEGGRFPKTRRVHTSTTEASYSYLFMLQ